MHRKPATSVEPDRPRRPRRRSTDELLGHKLPLIIAGLTERRLIAPPFSSMRRPPRRTSDHCARKAGPVPLPFYSEPRPHAHEHVEIAVVLDGRVYFEILGIGRVVEQGTVVVFPPGVMHYDSYASRDVAYAVLWYILWPARPRVNISGYSPRTGFELLSVYEPRPALVPADDWDFASAISAKESTDVDRLRQFLFSLYAATLEAARRVGPLKPVEAARKAVSDAVEFLRTRMSDGPTVEMAAEYVGLSPTYLTTIVKKELGHPLHEILSQMRMEKARELLSRSSLCIKEIAAQCGFSTSDYFSRAFSRAAGRSPRAYRRQFAR